MSRAPIIRLCGTAATALAFAAVALPAQSLAADGETKLKLDGPAANALRAQGVRITPIKPAKGGNRAVSLPVAAGLAGSKTTLLRQRGGLELTAPGNRSARLTSLRLLIGKRSLVEAKLGGEQIDLFKVMRGGRRDVDPGSGRVQLTGLRLKLTRGAAGALARQLALAPVPARRFGTLASRLSGLARGDSGKPGTGGGPGGGESSNACPLPSTAGPPAESTPPPAVRPLGALDVTSASIRWRVRESFIRYIATGEGTSVSGGASADPPVLLPGASTPLSYDFRFPFAEGWLDPGANPGSPADDTAALHFDGGVRFQYSGHGIDLLTSDPEIELAGADSRAIFSISDNGGVAQRQVLVNLDLSRAAAIAQSGNSYTYERVPGAIPSGTASSVFAGFYAPGTDFGCFDVSFSTP
ncbi:MAG TPA: HtaA domain-containing protein [Solirubrobacterales bacterium]|nr:HtaA domain-containing protein [Solirubrobacterales bacterium]